MFEKSLSDKFKRIFDFNDVSYNQPGDSKEQECLFIEIEKSSAMIKDGLAVYRVNGKCSVYAPHEKLPFGYFAKQIRKADLADTKDLFFYEIEGSDRVLADIVARTFSFVYFFTGQYDPELGTITSITTEVTE